MSELIGEIPGTESANTQSPQESAPETIQRIEIRIPQSIKKDIKPYIAGLTFDEGEKNKDASFLQAVDEGRARLGQPPIDPVASAKLKGRPKQEPYNQYRYIQEKYKKALGDSERDIRRDSRRSYPGINVFGEKPKINAEQAEKRRLDLEVDVTDLLGFLHDRILHKNDNLIRAFSEIAEQEEIVENSSGNERRRAELKIPGVKRNIFKQAKERDKLSLWHDTLDTMSRGETDERTADKENRRRMKQLEKFYKHIDKSPKDQELLLDELREEMNEAMQERETEQPQESASPDAEEQEAFAEGEKVSWRGDDGTEHSGTIVGRRKKNKPKEGQ